MSSKNTKSLMSFPFFSLILEFCHVFNIKHNIKMKKYPIIAFCILLVFAAFFGFCSSSSKTAEEVEIPEVSKSHLFTSPYIPEVVEFAGEPLPIHLFDVRENLERELIVNMNFHSSTLQYLKRVTRYFPVIEPILAAHGIPDDFKYLALIESDFRNRVSPRGATGFWQFMRAAAIDFGLEMNNEVDERYHLEKSTIAASRYLNDAYRIFGSWTMAAAAYNMGRAGLTAQVRRQRANNYYDLILNEETARYVFRIAAVKLILNDPLRYGFYVPEDRKYRPIPYTEVEVRTSIPDLIDFAANHNTNYRMLRLINPWLRGTSLTNTARKTYIIKIPEEGFRVDATHRIDDEEVEKIERANESSQLQEINR